MGNPITKNRMIDGGDTWEVEGALDIVSGGVQTIESGASLVAAEGSTVTGFPQTTTFASEAEGKTGTNTTKEINPKVLKAVIEDKLANLTWGVDIIVGALTLGVINVALQLVDIAGEDLSTRGSVRAYLSDDENGDSLAAVAPSGGIAIGTDGLAIPVVANKYLELISESDGAVDLDIEEAGTDTWYLIVVLPNGKLYTSDPIVFTTA